jgi:hypothetical protein
MYVDGFGLLQLLFRPDQKIPGRELLGGLRRSAVDLPD